MRLGIIIESIIVLIGCSIGIVCGVISKSIGLGVSIILHWIVGIKVLKWIWSDNIELDKYIR